MHFHAFSQQRGKTNMSKEIKDLKNITARASYFRTNRAPASQVQRPVPGECEAGLTKWHLMSRVPVRLAYLWPVITVKRQKYLLCPLFKAQADMKREHANQYSKVCRPTKHECTACLPVSTRLGREGRIIRDVHSALQLENV